MTSHSSCLILPSSFAKFRIPFSNYIRYLGYIESFYQGNKKKNFPWMNEQKEEKADLEGSKYLLV